MCLQHLLPGPEFQPAPTAAIWLPPAGGFDEESPSLEDLRLVDLTLLSLPLDGFLFRGLPQILTTPQDRVSWHLNPNCVGCPYTSSCSRRAVEDGKLGGMSNISFGHAKVLGTVLSLWRDEEGSRGTGKDISDIEDLGKLFDDGEFMEKLSRSNPITVRKAKRILALPARARDKLPRKSPLVEAARKKEIQVSICCFLFPERLLTFGLVSADSSETELYITKGRRRCDCALPDFGSVFPDRANCSVLHIRLYPSAISSTTPTHSRWQSRSCSFSSANNTGPHHSQRRLAYRAVLCVFLLGKRCFASSFGPNGSQFFRE